MEGFFPKPIELSSLEADHPKLCDLGEGVEAVALLHDGALRVFRENCPHMGAPMSRGIYDPAAGRIQCPWHGYRYDADTGAFVENPNDKIFGCMKGLYQSYKPEGAPTLQLTSFTCEIKGNQAWVRRPGTK
jgi:nitrite reductase/ring-hydroxylating ferredoxin subunit